LPGDKATGACC